MDCALSTVSDGMSVVAEELQRGRWTCAGVTSHGRAEARSVWMML